MNKGKLSKLKFVLVESSDRPKYVPPWTGIAKDFMNPTEKEIDKYLEWEKNEQR